MKVSASLSQGYQIEIKFTALLATGVAVLVMKLADYASHYIYNIYIYVIRPHGQYIDIYKNEYGNFERLQADRACEHRRTFGRSRGKLSVVCGFPKSQSDPLSDVDLRTFRGRKDHINTRILETMISGIPVIVGLGTRLSDPYVCVGFWAPRIGNPERGITLAGSICARCGLVHRSRSY